MNDKGTINVFSSPTAQLMKAPLRRVQKHSVDGICRVKDSWRILLFVELLIA
jgi:hypothetical protein